MARAVNLRSITSLRFFAALLVVLHHAFGPEGIPVLNLGFLGVTFFFVLSGFILTWADSARHGVVAFYQNRIARIFPLHLATLGIAVLLPFGLTDSPATLIQNLTLTQAWSNDGAHSFNWVSWSISVEAFFYLLFPFAFVALRNRSMKALLLVAAIAILVQLGFSEWIRTTDLSNAHFLTYDFPPYRLGEFIVGICLGHALLGGWRMSPRMTRLVYSAAVLLAVAIVTVNVLEDLGRPRSSIVFVPVVCVLIYCAAVTELKRPTFWLTNRRLVKLGEWSFALYMVHMLVIRGVSGAFGLAEPAHLPLTIGLIAVAFSLVASGVASEFIERPMEKVLRAKKRSHDNSPAMPSVPHHVA